MDLDLGCGSGLPITMVLIDEGLNVSAIDAGAGFGRGVPEQLPAGTRRVWVRRGLVVLRADVRRGHLVGTDVPPLQPHEQRRSFKESLTSLRLVAVCYHVGAEPPCGSMP